MSINAVVAVPIEPAASPHHKATSSSPPLGRGSRAEPWNPTMGTPGHRCPHRRVLWWSAGRAPPQGVLQQPATGSKTSTCSSSRLAHFHPMLLYDAAYDALNIQTYTTMRERLIPSSAAMRRSCSSRLSPPIGCNVQSRQAGPKVRIFVHMMDLDSDTGSSSV